MRAPSDPQLTSSCALRAVRPMSGGDNGGGGGGGTAELQRRIERAGDADTVRAALAEAIAALDVAGLAPRGEGGGAAVSGEWLAFVLDVVVPQWAACFTGAERARLVDAFFARAEAQEALTALHAHVARPTAHAEGLQPIAELLVRRVPELIRAAAASPSPSLWPLTLSALLSLPERLANRRARLTPALHPTSAPAPALRPLTPPQRLRRRRGGAGRRARRGARARPLSGRRTPRAHCAPRPRGCVSTLLRRDHTLSAADVVASRLLSLEAPAASALCALLPESSLQSVIGAILHRAPSAAVLDALLSPLYRRSALAAHLLSHKFLLTRAFPAPAPASLVALAVAAGRRTEVLERVAAVWSQAAFTQHALALQACACPAPRATHCLCSRRAQTSPTRCWRSSTAPSRPTSTPPPRSSFRAYRCTSHARCRRCAPTACAWRRRCPP